MCINLPASKFLVEESMIPMRTRDDLTTEWCHEEISLEAFLYLCCYTVQYNNAILTWYCPKTRTDNWRNKRTCILKRKGRSVKIMEWYYMQTVATRPDRWLQMTITCSSKGSLWSPGRRFDMRLCSMGLILANKKRSMNQSLTSQIASIFSYLQTVHSIAVWKTTRNSFLK